MLSAAAPANASRVSIAVLPFANMSGDAEQEYFADGVTEDIITALSKLSQLFVIARNSSFTFKGRNVLVAEVGKSLGGATSSKEACEKPVLGSGSLPSLQTRRPAATSGPSGSTGN